jgi:hypothetical protein
MIAIGLKGRKQSSAVPPAWLCLLCEGGQSSDQGKSLSSQHPSRQAVTGMMRSGVGSHLLGVQFVQASHGPWETGPL